MTGGRRLEILYPNLQRRPFGDTRCLEAILNQGKDIREMSNTSGKPHAGHDHRHGADCGHTAVRHGDHTDYLHDGHLHHPKAGGVEEHVIAVDGTNPADCTPDHACASHPADHVHGQGCGHEPVPHGDHVDYLVAGHLHHPHGDHCDDHGPVETVTK